MKKEKLTMEKYLDKTLAEHSQNIVFAVDEIMTKHLQITEKRFDTAEKRMDRMEGRLSKEINNVQTLIDAYVKQQEDFRQEFIIMKEELKKIKAILKKKLGIEIQVA